MCTAVFVTVYVIIFCHVSLPDVFISIPVRQVKLALQLGLGKSGLWGNGTGLLYLRISPFLNDCTVEPHYGHPRDCAKVTLKEE